MGTKTVAQDEVDEPKDLFDWDAPAQLRRKVSLDSDSNFKFFSYYTILRAWNKNWFFMRSGLEKGRWDRLSSDLVMSNSYFKIHISCKLTNSTQNFFETSHSVVLKFIDSNLTVNYLISKLLNTLLILIVTKLFLKNLYKLAHYITSRTIKRVSSLVIGKQTI